ncbi:MAG: SCP2 domain-containing protein [Burkholderiales bacterium]
MIAKAFSSFVNHLLIQQSWASERLATHAGGRIRVQMPPIFDASDFAILDSGLLQAEPTQTAPDLTISMKIAALPMLLTHHPDTLKHVELSGNAALASSVQALFARLQWDVEEDLSRVVGDIAAHRMAGIGRALFAWQRDAFSRMATNFAEYWTEEKPMLARRAEFERFANEVRDLELNLARIEARLLALRQTIE